MLRVAGRRKLDLEKILAVLNVTCPTAMSRITPDKQVRIDSEQMRCPWCGKTFSNEQKAR